MIHEYIIKVDDDKKDIVGGMPLIDKPQELVRCKDCRRYYANGGNCDQVLAEWFCADGERK